MDFEAIEQNLLWTDIPVSTGTWEFQCNWKAQLETWTSPKNHAKNMINKFIALSRTVSTIEA